MKLLKDQYVCKRCGYNIIGYYPEFCPFCGASNDNFITAEECSQNYRIVSLKVNDNVYRLNSFPNLGLEHAAYCIKIDGKYIWIDCPSTFSKNLEPMDKILFTHHHFLGASNLYREYYTAFVWIHKEDSTNFLALRHSFDKKFKEDFKLLEIEAFHINGHTQGFTFYIYEGVLFICDYVVLNDNQFILNPYGSQRLTIEGARKLKDLIEKRDIETVCGVNYVMKFDKWYSEFTKLLN